MYYIIGADRKEYGPITGEQLNAWIIQGRANSLTLARMDGATEWKPLSLFPEFAGLVASTGVPPIAQPIDPRKSKLVAGLLGIFLGGFGVHRFYLGHIGIGIAQIIVTLVTCGIGHLWGFVEGLLIIAGRAITTDAEGKSLKE